MRARHFTFVLLGIAACTSAPASAQWRAEAERTLTLELQKAYPDVRQWSVAPLVSEQQETLLSDVDVRSIRVTKLGARSAVRLRTHKFGKSHESTVWYAVEGIRSALVASQPIAAGASFEASAIRGGEVKAFVAQCTPVTDSQSVAGMRAVRKLETDDPVCREWIEPQPLVARGDNVAVYAKVGLVTITATGIAQEDAELGERLKVRSPSSGEVYSAAVSGRGEVMVRE